MKRWREGGRKCKKKEVDGETEERGGIKWRKVKSGEMERGGGGRR